MRRIHSERKFPHDKRALFPCVLSTVRTGTCWFVYNGRLTFNEKIPERGQIRTAPSPHHHRCTHSRPFRVRHEHFTVKPTPLHYGRTQRVHSESDQVLELFPTPSEQPVTQDQTIGVSGGCKCVFQVYSGFSKNAIYLDNRPIAFRLAQTVDIDSRLDSLNSFFRLKRLPRNHFTGIFARYLRRERIRKWRAHGNVSQ